MERERVYGKGQFASSQTSLEGQNGVNGTGGMASSYGMALPNLPPPTSTYSGTTAVGFDAAPLSPRLDFAPQPRARAGAGDVPNAVMQHPMADRETTNIADVPTAHHRGSAANSPSMPSSALQPSAMPMGEDTQSGKFGMLGRGARSPPIASSMPSRSASTSASNTGMVASPSMPPPIEHRRSSTMTDKKQERRVSVGSISNSLGRASLGRRGSSTGKTNTITSPNDGTSASAWIDSPQEAGGIIGRQGVIMSEPEPEHEPELELEPHVAPSGSTNGEVKNIYLKGLFSVSTTSTKPAATLIRDIDTVLSRIGIKHRSIKGGFECLHVPSIDLNSVVNGDEASMSLPSTAGPSGIGSTKRKGSLRRKSSKTVLTGGGSGSRGPSPLRQNQGSSSGTVSASEAPGPTPPRRGKRGSGEGEEDDVDWAFGTSGRAGSSLVVRFEIYVVKVRVPQVQTRTFS
jgi:hypothetical protein